MGTVSDPLNAASGLRGLIRDSRMEIEEARCLPPRVIEGLKETGLCRLAVPASQGGYEAEPVVALRVFEELAGTDASVAWLAWNSQLPCFLGRHLVDSVRAELYGDADLLFANSTRPSGKALVVEGGYCVSGRWALVSGCQHADWIPVMCTIMEGDAPRMVAPDQPQRRMAYLPKGSYRIVDTWHVGGLRGTGSHDVEVDDVFVPAEHTFAWTDPNYLDRPLYRMPFLALMAAGCAAICLGIAQTAIDTLVDLAASKIQVDPGTRLRDRPAVQASVGACAADLDAARLLLHTSHGDVWETCRRGVAVTDLQAARVWGGALQAAKTAKAVVTAMYEAAGTSALYVDCPIERAHRDIHAVAQHVILAPRNLEDVGRVRLGLPPSNPLFAL